MSYLALPRLGFKGTTAAVNPSTANNADNAPLLDNGRVTVQKVPSSPDPRDYAAYRAWLMSLITVQFPAAAGAAPQTIVDMPAEWNYYGDHATTFGDAAINCIWLRDGRRSTSGPDAVLGARVTINARLVDLDPADNYSTQIIAGLFKIVDIGADGLPVDLLIGTNPSVAYSRWINFRRPMGAAIFQCVIPKERLTIRTGYSAALDALEHAVAQAAGISVRYCLYALRHAALSADVLHEKFQRGEYAMNPRAGRVLGSIGVWHAGDMLSAPVGRLLFVPGSKYCSAAPIQNAAPARVSPLVKTHRDLDRLWAGLQHHAAPSTGLSAAPAPPDLGYVPGPTVAVIDHARRVISLDLLSTFLETAATDPGAQPTDLAKQDIGPVTLELVYRDAHGQEQVAAIGQVPYDQRAYEEQAGVVEISYAGRPELHPYLDGGTLRLSHEPDAQVPDRILLQEIDTEAVETDDRCVYVQQDADVTITLRVFTKGEPAQQPTMLLLEQWRDHIYVPPVDRSVPSDGNRPVMAATQATYTRVEPDDPALAIPPTVAVPSGGVASLTIAPRGPASPGCYKIRFIPPGARPDMRSDLLNPAFDPTIDFFANLRVLPTDDYSHLEDSEITWQLVYDEVFSYYALVYPIMSTIIPWGPDDAPNDVEHLQEYATLIRRLVDETNIDSPMYMPITRELSAGKRALVQRWCDLQMRPARDLE